MYSLITENGYKVVGFYHQVSTKYFGFGLFPRLRNIFSAYYGCNTPKQFDSFRSKYSDEIKTLLSDLDTLLIYADSVDPYTNRPILPMDEKRYRYLISSYRKLSDVQLELDSLSIMKAI